MCFTSASPGETNTAKLVRWELVHWMNVSLGFETLIPVSDHSL